MEQLQSDLKQLQLVHTEVSYVYNLEVVVDLLPYVCSLWFTQIVSKCDQYCRDKEGLQSTVDKKMVCTVCIASKIFS